MKNMHDDNFDDDDLDLKEDIEEETDERSLQLGGKKGLKKIQGKTKEWQEEREQEEEAEGQLTVDVYQTPTDIVVQTMVAGVRPEDLTLSITRDMVTIRGKRLEGRSEETSDFFHQELYWGAFSRTIVLPAEIEIEEAEAKEQHGLLTLILPKIDKNRQSKLKVKSN